MPSRSAPSRMSDRVRFGLRLLVVAVLTFTTGAVPAPLRLGPRPLVAAVPPFTTGAVPAAAADPPAAAERTMQPVPPAPGPEIGPGVGQPGRPGQPGEPAETGEPVIVLLRDRADV